MRVKAKTLQYSLFVKYSAFIIAILLIIGLAVYFYFSNLITAKVHDQQVQLLNSVVNSVDSEITKMNTVSMNVLYSNLLKDKYYDYLSVNMNNKKNDVLLYSKKYSSINTVIDVIMAIIGPFQSVSQANIYDFNGNMVGAGIFNGRSSMDVRKKNWYRKTMELNGFKNITGPENIQMLDPIYSGVKNHKFMSLSRVYEDRNYKRLGIVEIVQDCNTLFKYVNDVINGDHNVKIYIMNEAGVCVYPYNGSERTDGVYFMKEIDRQKLKPLVLHEYRSSRNDLKEVMTYTSSEYSGWKAIVVEDKKSIFSPLNNFTNGFMLFLLAVILLSLLISFIVARNVTIPLKKLRNAIKNVELEDFFEQGSLKLATDSSLNEIERLNHAFHRMHENLGKSINELLIARAEEMNARLMAIQSQMSPHFLYNNLANISVMAEEGMTREIVQLCGDISFMLRYISEEKKSGIDLLSEINYTKRFLNCMKLRYEEHLLYEIDIPEELNSIIIPKLMIQPLVENSIKHGLNTSPPWHIRINGLIREGNWYIIVTDTGEGFSEEVLEYFEHFMDNIKEISKIETPSIGGMGLVNICLRLKLLYKNEGIFHLRNLPQGGAEVTIGGSIINNREEQEYEAI